MKHIRYIRYIAIHKWFVMLACFRRGLIWQGLIHDWSKFLPSEWLPYAESFYGDGRFKHEARMQAINVLGHDPFLPEYVIRDRFDRAWLAHQHRNPHHWQYFLQLPASLAAEHTARRCCARIENPEKISSDARLAASFGLSKISGTEGCTESAARSTSRSAGLAGSGKTPSDCPSGTEKTTKPDAPSTGRTSGTSSQGIDGPSCATTAAKTPSAPAAGSQDMNSCASITPTVVAKNIGGQTPGGLAASPPTAGRSGMDSQRSSACSATTAMARSEQTAIARTSIRQTTILAEDSGRFVCVACRQQFNRSVFSALEMPVKYAVEMVCDWDGAGRAITGKSGGTQAWYLKNAHNIQLHPETLKLVAEILDIAPGYCAFKQAGG